MAAFTTLSLAEIRAYAKTADGTWTEAHAAINPAGTIIVRALRKMSNAAANWHGEWAEITDDATA